MRSAQDNIIHTGEPSRSALRVATLRAAHQLLDEPIVFDDPVALPILGAKLEAEVRADPFQFNEPFSRGLRATLVVRSRFAEDELAQRVAAGVRQYVVLGAGLDTFAYRNIHAHAGLAVYEVDHASTQAWKRQLLRDASIEVPGSVHFVPVDFERDRLGDALEQAGLRRDRPTYFSWLGVTMYLHRDAVIDTLRFVASLPPGSAIGFDYRVRPALLNPLEQFFDGYVRQQIEALGEPWKSDFDPSTFKEEVRALGFASIEDVGQTDLNPLYLARRKDGLRMGIARLMCARV